MGGRTRAAWARLTELAQQQRGLFTSSQAVQAGLSRSVLSRSRDLHCTVVLPSVYRFLQSPSPSEQLLQAALLWQPSGWLSHGTAALLHQLEGIRSVRIELSVPRNLGHKPRYSVVVHRIPRPPDDELTHLDGLTLTRPGRTLLDLAPSGRFLPLAIAFDDAWRRRLFHPRQLARSIDRATTPRAGLTRIRRLLDDADLRQRPLESALEVRVWWELRTARLPLPVPGFTFFDDHGQPGRIDFAYPTHGIAIEAQSVAHHGTREAFEADAHRTARLTALGWSVLPVTWRNLKEKPGAFARLVAEALRTRKRSARADTAGHWEMPRPT